MDVVSHTIEHFGTIDEIITDATTVSYQASCSHCGWFSDELTSFDQATDSLDEHLQDAWLQ